MSHDILGRGIGNCPDAVGRAKTVDLTKAIDGSKPGELPKTKPAEPEQPKPPVVIVKTQALLIIDDDAKSSGLAAAASSAKLLSESLASGLGKSVNVVTLHGADVNPSRVFEQLRSLAVDSDDALVVCMVGPGSYDEIAKDFIFNTAGGSIKRNELKTEALAKKARLTVLLTDPVSLGFVADPIVAEVVSTEAQRSMSCSAVTRESSMCTAAPKANRDLPAVNWAVASSFH